MRLFLDANMLFTAAHNPDGRLVALVDMAQLGRCADVDVLVVLNGPVRPSQEITRTGGIVSRICLEFDAVIHCLFMDKQRFSNSRSPLLDNIAREASEV